MNKYLLKSSLLGMLGALVFLTYPSALLGDVEVPATLDFGRETIDQVDEDDVLIRNTGAENVTLQSFSLSGSDTGDFDINDDNDCRGEVLKQNETCRLYIEFEPDTVGNLTATLTIATDLGDLTVDLEGEGEPRESGLDVSDSSVNFEDTRVGYATLEEITLRNEGDEMFEIDDISIQGTDSADFDFVDDRDCDGEEMEPGDVCYVMVLFEPDSVGVKSAEIHIEADDTEVAEIVTLDAEALLKEDGIETSESIVDFGDVNYDDADDTEEIQVRNLLGTKFEIENVTITGKDGGNFVIEEDECEDEFLADNSGTYDDSCTISILANPTSNGQKSAVLEIYSSDSNNDELFVPLLMNVVGGPEGDDDELPIVKVDSDRPVQICSSDFTNASGFPDVEDSSFKDFILHLQLNGVISGYPDGTYGPGNLVTRAHMAKFIVNAFNFNINVGDASFPDVNAEEDTSKYILTLANYGVVSGFSDGTYKPGAVVTREQVTKFIVEAMLLAKDNMDLSNVEPAVFSDVDPNNPFVAYIAYLASEDIGVVEGYSDETYKPGLELAREQMAKFVWNSMRHLYSCS